MKALFLAALSVPALVSTAHTGLHDHVHGFIVRKLDLTQAQQDAARAVIAAHHPALLAKGQAVFQARADLIQALADPQTSETQIRDLETRASAAHLAMELEVSQVVKGIAPILTPEQQLKARQLVLEGRGHVEAMLASFHGAGQTAAQ